MGKVRENNEDSIFSTDSTIGCLDNIYVVADGMGGHNAGEIASSSAIEFLKEYLENSQVDLDTYGIIMDSVFSANEKVFQKSKSESSRKGMGTTITLCTIKDDKAYFGHVGDSRAYLIDDDIKQITFDHTYVNQMMQKGLMTKEQALVDPNRNMITRAIGIEPTVMVDVEEVDVKEGNIIMLCSDGLTGLVSDETILSTVNKYKDDVNKACDTLIEMALDKGGIDNISVILILV